MILLLLFLASFFAALISGVAGFGGALLLLPLLSYAVGIKAAIPILTIAQIFGNASRTWFGRAELRWKPITYFLICAVPFSMLGSYFFVVADSSKIKIGVGILLILIVIWRRLKIKKINFSDKSMFVGGGLTGFISGIAGSAGPLGAAFFLGLNLPAVAYVASEAFTALIMHITKLTVYSKLSFAGKTEFYYGIILGIAMILGSWAGKKIIEKLPRHIFVFIVEILLLVSGLHLIFFN